MKLSAYLSGRGISVREFSLRIGAKGRATVHRYCNGARIPDRETMARIVAATDGQVQPNDFFDTGGGPPEAPAIAPEAGR